MPKFFEALFAGMEITRFEVGKIFGEDAAVVDRVTLEYTAKGAGRKCRRSTKCTSGTSAAGKVRRLRHRADTLLQARSIGAV